MIYTVSQLNQTAHQLLNNELGLIQVQGEISNFKKASSGHCYFSLKDSNAQVNCVLFSSQANLLSSHLLENGQQVVATATVGLYQPRGDYQLNIRHMEDAGLGLLQIEFEKLKKKLAEQGLFDSQLKQPLPVTPHTIGVVTSPSGAAIRDILATLKRRFIAAQIIIYPTEVQGKTAAPKIAKAIAIANTRKECDVLIVARGGGSTEDLWPFNEEIVAWAIFNSEIPVVTGIGHQIDTTIADYVSDHTASTPTAAAEAVAPNQKDWLTQTRHWLQRANHAMHQFFMHKKHELAMNKQFIQQFRYQLQEKEQRLDHLENTLKHCFASQLSQKKNYLTHWLQRLNQQNPFVIVQRNKAQLTPVMQKIHQIMQQQMHERRQRFSQMITALRVVSPLATLERGYALAMTTQKNIIRDSHDVKQADTILVKLAKINLICKVEKIYSQQLKFGRGL